MSEQDYGDTTQEFNDACREHGHRRSAKRTSLPYFWVVLKSALRRFANKTARRLVVSITVKTIRHERSSVGTCCVTNGIVNFLSHVYISSFEERNVVTFLSHYPSGILDFVDVGNILGCPTTGTYILM
jgi:hypothetical protein